MISVSQAIKNSCNADSNTHTEYIVINNQTIYIKGKLSASAYKDTTFFGTFNLKVLEFETPNNVQFRNREFEYYKVIDGNAFKIGTFITTEVKDNDSKEIVKVTANDYGLKFAVPYTTSLDYSSNVTLYDVLEECCTNAGVTLENQSIDNGDFIVDSNQFVNGEMIGDVICAIAGISGNFATITSQDKLRLTFANNTGEILKDYTNLEDKRDTHPITSVSIGLSQVQGVEAILRDEDLIEQYGEHWLIINDNPFSYTLEKRQQLVTAIFNKVKGFGYSSFKSEYSYKPYLELGDKIKFKNKNGDLIDSIILRYEFDNDECIFEAPSITDASVDYERAPKPEEVAKRAEIIANQAEASINSVVSDIEDINDELNGYYALTSDTTFQENKSYYRLENGAYVLVEEYDLTHDETYQDGTDYYTLINDEYVLLVPGEDYTIGDTITGSVYEQNYAIGDTIPSNTYYELINDSSLAKRLTKAESTLTTQGSRLDIVSTNIDPETGDVLSLKRMNYEMGGNGFIIDDGSGYKSVANTTGQYYYDNNTMTGKYTKDGSVQKDMALFGKYYYGVQETVNVETFSKDDAMFVAELYTDANNEVGFGHFYNGS